MLLLERHAHRMKSRAVMSFHTGFHLFLTDERYQELASLVHAILGIEPRPSFLGRQADSQDRMDQ